MISVCVIDDQHLVRQGLVGLLGLVEDVEVVACAADGVEALPLIARHQPDVVLLDLQMPRMDGLTVLRALGGYPNPPAVLVLTTFGDGPLALQSIVLGARGFLLKDVTLDALASAIRTLAAGGTLIEPTITQRVIQGAMKLGQAPAGELPPEVDPLTDREYEVLRLIAGGLNNREISSALRIAEGTVKNHTSNILTKMHVRDRTQAVLRALALGLLGDRGTRSGR